eukprot:2191725-Amphidinium_carterae.1
MTARPQPGAPKPEAVALVPDVNSFSNRYSAASQRTQNAHARGTRKAAAAARFGAEHRRNSWHDSKLSTSARMSLAPQPSLCEEINHLRLRHGEQRGKIDLTTLVAKNTLNTPRNQKDTMDLAQR